MYLAENKRANQGAVMRIFAFGKVCIGETRGPGAPALDRNANLCLWQSSHRRNSGSRGESPWPSCGTLAPIKGRLCGAKRGGNNNYSPEKGTPG